ncbi:MAG: hypothetical protein ABSH53_19030 [Holophaga sp.]|jgi:hypothetical protein
MLASILPNRSAWLLAAVLALPPEGTAQAQQFAKNTLNVDIQGEAPLRILFDPYPAQDGFSFWIDGLPSNEKPGDHSALPLGLSVLYDPRTGWDVQLVPEPDFWQAALRPDRPDGDHNLTLWPQLSLPRIGADHGGLQLHQRPRSGAPVDPADEEWLGELCWIREPLDLPERSAPE